MISLAPPLPVASHDQATTLLNDEWYLIIFHSMIRGVAGVLALPSRGLVFSLRLASPFSMGRMGRYRAKVGLGLANASMACMKRLRKIGIPRVLKFPLEFTFHTHYLDPSDVLAVGLAVMYAASTSVLDLSGSV